MLDAAPRPRIRCPCRAGVPGLSSTGPVRRPAEFGEEQVVARPGGHAGIAVADVQQVCLGRVEAAGAAGAEGESQLGVDPALLAALFGGDTARLLVQVTAPVPVVGEQREPAEPGRSRRHLRPKARLSCHVRPFVLQAGRLLVLALDPGERGERGDGLQLAPAVPSSPEGAALRCPSRPSPSRSPRTKASVRAFNSSALAVPPALNRP